ncbi:hypothetical protein GCM10011610_25240 [Nocardia rhizosphaerihabitans]|uniref:Uncharacterized protein n=1 Tax=Nocardia rhizosphaerihabitans TaxID=1691570 RepID=A0ABQ2KD42_9NOCA|nr:hypothetical protein GCM10011610_25240 [Nocardia rhizosphaerihabitans]
MTRNRIRVAAAAAALIPMIALGSGFATAAPADSVVPVIAPVPVQVEPAALTLFGLGFLAGTCTPAFFVPIVGPFAWMTCVA